MRQVITEMNKSTILLYGLREDKPIIVKSNNGKIIGIVGRYYDKWCVYIKTGAIVIRDTRNEVVEDVEEMGHSAWIE